MSHKSNISCGHPSQYKERDESHFKCDNGFKVISRIYGGKEVFNFKDLDGHIICDIDFVQVKPFSEYKDMTARGYTPNRKCYIIFENGYMEEVNEQKKVGAYNSIITDCINTSLKKYIKEQIKV